MISLVPEGTPDSVGLSRAMAGSSAPICPSPYALRDSPFLHGRAGLQHAAAAGSRRRDLSAGHCRLPCRHDRTPAARLQCGRRSEAVFPADAAPKRSRSVFLPAIPRPPIVSQAMDYSSPARLPPEPDTSCASPPVTPADRRDVLDDRRGPAWQL